MNWRRTGFIASLIALSAALLPHGWASSQTRSHFAGSRGPVSGTVRQAPLPSVSYARIPLGFEPNRGQAPPGVGYVAHGGDYTAYFRRSGLSFNVASVSPRMVHDEPSAGVRRPEGAREVVRRAELSLHLVGSSARPRLLASGRLRGVTNYLIGNDRRHWTRNVPIFSGLRYNGVYHGVDMVFHGSETGLEYDFHVHPGIDPRIIRLSFGGVRRVRTGPGGDLRLVTPVGILPQAHPTTYQVIGGRRHEVSGTYAVRRDGTVAFRLRRYDRSRPLVIDPVIRYGSLLGGNGNEYFTRMAADPQGNVYLEGSTFSADFPVRQPAGGRPAAGNCPQYSSDLKSPFACPDLFVAKLNAAGNGLVYSTYLGGSNDENAGAIAVDSSGAVDIVGSTRSSDFPTTNTVQAGFGGGTCTIAYTATVTASGPCSDGFAARLNPSGSALIFSTFLGGASEDDAAGVSAAPDQSVYVSGVLGGPSSLDMYRVTPGSTGSDAFVIKLRSDGGWDFGTLLGGTSYDLASDVKVDAAGDIHVTGETGSGNFPTVNAIQPRYEGTTGLDLFVASLAPGGRTLVFSTYVSGSNGQSGSLPRLGVDALGNTYVATSTWWRDLPVARALQTAPGGGSCFNGGPYSCPHGYVAEFDPAGRLRYGTYFGGSFYDWVEDVAVDSAGEVFIAGFTDSNDFPSVASVQPGLRSSGEDQAFVARIGVSGSPLLFSTLLGTGAWSRATGVAADDQGDVYVTGATSTRSGGLYTIPGSSLGGYDVFALKIHDTPPPPVPTATFTATVTPTLPPPPTNVPPTATPTLPPPPTATATSAPPLDTVVPKSTKMLGSAALGHLKNADASEPLDVTRPDLALKFANPNSKVKSLKSGNVLVSGITPETPDGMLRKVVSVSRHGKRETVTTEPATIQDAITQGTIEFHQPLTPQGVQSAHALLRGVAPLMRPSQADVQICPKMDNVKLYDDGTNSVTIEGSDCLTITPDVRIDVHGFPPQVSSSFSVSVSADPTLTVKVEGKVDKSKEIPLASYYFAAIPVGPLVFVPKLLVSMKLDGSISATMTAEATQHATLTTSVACENTSCRPSYSWDPGRPTGTITANDEADASVSVPYHLELLIDGVVGPDLTLEPYVRAHVGLADNPWWRVYMGIKASGGFDVDVASVLRVSASYTFLDWSQGIADAGGPFIKPPPRGYPTPEDAIRARLQQSNPFAPLTLQYIGNCPPAPSLGQVCSQQLATDSAPPVYTYAVNPFFETIAPLDYDTSVYWYLGRYADGSWAFIAQSPCKLAVSVVDQTAFHQCLASNRPGFSP